MSQAQVTDFFSRRKKVLGGPAKAAAIAAPLCSSPVHEEFVRVIEEAAGLDHEEPAAEETPSSPRTPKRTSADAEFDLGAAVFPAPAAASAAHSTAKKRRQAAAGAAEKASRKSARKKLLLPAEAPQAAAHPPAAADPVREQAGVDLQQRAPAEAGGQPCTVLSKEDISALKARLQRIRRHVDKVPQAASSSAAPQTSSKAKAPKFSVARAKELAANALKRQEEKDAEKTEAQSPDSPEQPAYQRYHNLAQAVPPGLSLPYHYKVLAEMFRSMDTVIAMLYNRSETATFAKIKQGVQDMMHKRFEESHVGQIKAVFPEAYAFRQEKNIPTFNSSVKKGSYQLTVEPVILSERKEARPVLSASRLLERRHVFHQNLLSIVKQHHKVFLSSLDPPVLVPEDKLTRWHPRFNVDTVPPVQTSSLPPVPQTEKMATAQEVLDKARSLITPKMEKALAVLALQTEDKAAEQKEPAPAKNPAVPQTPAAPPAQVPSALTGVSQSLLDRIRAKEAQKLQAAMTRNSNQEERLLMMSRLGELARILRNVFVVEKKPALIMEVACNRMVASYRSALSTGEMEKHIRLLAEVAGDWLSILPVRKDFYLKLNKNMELSVVLDKLNSRLREEERL